MATPRWDRYRSGAVLAGGAPPSAAAHFRVTRPTVVIEYAPQGDPINECGVKYPT
jgi:hypothetical protein